MGLGGWARPVPSHGRVRHHADMTRTSYPPYQMTKEFVLQYDQLEERKDVPPL